MYLMLMAIQCEMVKVCRTMYIVHQIVEDIAEVKYTFTPPPPPPPNSLLMYGSVAFTINHVSEPVSV